MRRALPIAIAVVAVLAALLVAAAGTAPALPGPVRGRSELPPMLAARFPAIAGLAHFDVNDQNPFVPWQLREGYRPRQPDTRIIVMEDPVGGGGLVRPDDRRQGWPVVRTARPAAPMPLGVAAHESGRQALVVQSAAGTRILASGDAVDGWTLLRFDLDAAEFVDSAGRTVRLALAR